VFQHDRRFGGLAQVRKLVGIDSQSLDSFGKAVALSGDTLVVGAPRHDVSGSADTGAAYLFSRNQGGADAWGQSRKLLNTNGAAGDFFGITVAVDGAVVVVGAHLDDDEARGLSNSGSLTLFLDGRQLTKLTGAGARADDQFGVAVAISGDLIVAGARQHDSGALDAGAAYLFTLASETWSETRRYDSSLACCKGQTVAIEGDTLVAGENVAGNGLIRIFQRNRGGFNRWGEIKRIKLAVPPTHTGVTLALDGDVLAVLGANDVHTFERNQGGPDFWGQKSQKFVDAIVGTRLALDGNTLVIGEPSVTESEQHGIIRVRDSRIDEGDNRVPTQLLLLRDVPTDPTNLSGFGSRVTLDGNVLVTMSFTPSRSPGVPPGPTEVYIFERGSPSELWRFATFLRPADPSPGFAMAVAVDGDTIAMSTRPAFDPTGQYQPKSVSLFQRNQGGPNAWGEIKRLQVPPEARSFGAELALDGDILAVSAPQTDLANSAGGVIYLFERNIGGSNAWGLLTTLTGSLPPAGDDMGMQIALDGNTLAAAATGSTYIFSNDLGTPTGSGLQAAANPVESREPIAVSATTSSTIGRADGEVPALGFP
jgi:hypothetical protein